MKPRRRHRIHLWPDGRNVVDYFVRCGVRWCPVRLSWMLMAMPILPGTVEFPGLPFDLVLHNPETGQLSMPFGVT